MFLLLFNLSPIFYTHIKHRRPIVNIVFVAQIPCLYFILSLHKHQLKTGLKDLFFNFIDIVVARVWVGGTRATFLGGAFREAKYEKLRRRKNRNRKARAGKNSFPPTPFLFARPRFPIPIFPPPPNFVPVKLARRLYFSNLHAFTNSYPNLVNPINLYVLNCTGYSPILTPPKEAGG